MLGDTSLKEIYALVLTLRGTGKKMEIFSQKEVFSMQKVNIKITAKNIVSVDEMMNFYNLCYH